MTGFLRFFGILNIAVWLGAAIFFSFWAGPAIFSPEMKTLLGEKSYSYFSGRIAQIIIARYFHLQMLCGFLALIHVLADWLYSGKSARTFWLGLLFGLVTISLIGDFWIQPKLKELHQIKYNDPKPEKRQDAAQSFRAWHGASQAVNLLMMVGLASYLWRMANPPDSMRFLNAAKVRS